MVKRFDNFDINESANTAQLTPEQMTMVRDAVERMYRKDKKGKELLSVLDKFMGKSVLLSATQPVDPSVYKNYESHS